MGVTSEGRGADVGQRLIANPKRIYAADYPSDLAALMGEKQVIDAVNVISKWPGYRPTPVRALDQLARIANVGAISYKDEAGRFGLGSFKALGGAYAVQRLMERIERAPEAAAKNAGQKVTVCCATDGNHGRAVAWGAQLHGCDCVIFLHERVSVEREKAIAAYGARIVRIAGNYDDSVRAAARSARDNGWFVVSDTSYPGYYEIPIDVMAGYTMITEELSFQVEQPVTHVFLQAGVGGMAAALSADLWRRLGKQLPRLVLVEPTAANCLLRSIVAGKAETVTGGLETIMAGLACGEVSEVAWRILQSSASHAMVISDADAEDMMCRLADGAAGSSPIVAGESAVAGVAGLMRSAADDVMRSKLELDEDSHILCIGTEGATDPVLFEKITGRSPSEELSGKH